MIGRTHDLAAFTSLVIAAIYLPIETMSIGNALAVLLVAMVGGLLPDLDEPTADIWDTIPVGEVLGRVLSPLFGKHRNISHSILGIFIANFGSIYLFSLLKPYILLDLEIIRYAFMLGFLSHLFMDSLTQAGIPLLFPLRYKFGIPPFKSLRIKTGGLVEQLIVFPGLVLLNIYLIWHYYPVFSQILVK